MSPIYTRPIREQLEHDRVIRELQSRYKRKHEVAINPGSEQNQSVMVGDMAVYPDLVLLSAERGRRIEGTVEVETAESVHLLEARAEWGVLSRLKVPFHLYIPPQAFDTARRICDEQQFDVTEIWTYHTGLDQQVRFTQVYKSPNPPKASIPAPKPTMKPAAVVAPASPAAPPLAEKAPPRAEKAAAGAAPRAARPAAAKSTPKKPAATAAASPSRRSVAASKPAATTKTRAAKAPARPAAKAPARPAAKAAARPAAKAKAVVKAKAKKRR